MLLLMFVSDLRRYALSTLVNALLQSEKPIPFEFLINGTFLRTTLDQYLTANGISAETTLTVEYVRAIMPPVYLASFQHDEWVSSVDVLSKTSPAAIWAGNAGIKVPGQERILSGCYDGLLRVWNMSSEVIATSPSADEGGAHSAILAAKFISPSQIASSGLDRTVRIWEYSEDADGFSASITPKLELHGHKMAVNSLAVHHPSSRILSASQDHSIRFWSTKKSEAPPAPENLLPSTSLKSSKRQKTGSCPNTATRGSLTELKSHTGQVSDTIFAPNDHTVAYSSSWDHTVKTWDLLTSRCIDTRSTGAALFSLTALPSLNVLAAGSVARHITLIDPRASATTVSAMTLRGHSNAVVSLAVDPQNSYGLVSGSHDGTCRVWDVRSGTSGNEGKVGHSLYCIERESAKGRGKVAAGEGVKVFSVCWDSDVGIVSGSEDKRVQINRGKGIVGEQPS